MTSSCRYPLLRLHAQIWDSKVRYAVYQSHELAKWMDHHFDERDHNTYRLKYNKEDWLDVLQALADFFWKQITRHSGLCTRDLDGAGKELTERLRAFWMEKRLDFIRAQFALYGRSASNRTRFRFCQMYDHFLDCETLYGAIVLKTPPGKNQSQTRIVTVLPTGARGTTQWRYPCIKRTNYHPPTCGCGLPADKRSQETPEVTVLRAVEKDTGFKMNFMKRFLQPNVIQVKNFLNEDVRLFIFRVPEEFRFGQVDAEELCDTRWVKTGQHWGEIDCIEPGLVIKRAKSQLVKYLRSVGYDSTSSNYQCNPYLCVPK